MNIKTITILFTLFLIFSSDLHAGLLINEIACATAGDDWVELFYYSENKESMDISTLHVTMYYGGSERLSNDPVTIYSYDRPETPWDDRFVVVHLASPNKEDETDLTGDTNKNGYIDIYCNNYFSSLWETDCVVAIDNDNNYSNGGIIDFVAYSNRDGNVNSNIETYTKAAQSLNQWNICPGTNIQECMVFIGNETLRPYMTISRKNTSDSNSQLDFAVTKYMTPGRENIISGSLPEKGNLFRTNKKKINITPENFANGRGEIEIFVFENCNIRFRIFSSIGLLVFESPLYRDIIPGNFNLYWNLRGFGKKASAGLYITQIEATRTELKKSQQEQIYLILSQHKK